MNKPATPPRRVVQIATIPAYGDPDEPLSATYGALIVLLDDGSLWTCSRYLDAEWHRVPGPPGTEVQPDGTAPR